MARYWVVLISEPYCFRSIPFGFCQEDMGLDLLGMALVVTPFPIDNVVSHGGSSVETCFQNLLDIDGSDTLLDFLQSVELGGYEKPEDLLHF